MTAPAVRRSGGRPTAEAAVRLDATILDMATAAFLRDGYAATSIEAIAKACSVAKRTIYSRWDGKPALFRAVVERLIARWMSTSGEWDDAGDLEAQLRQAAERILAVALAPEAIALYRLLIAESGRFPALPLMLREAGANAGSARIAACLAAAARRGELPPHDTALATEQFMNLLLAGPQRRSLGLGDPLNAKQAAAWCDCAVRLFLHGVVSLRLPPPLE